MKLVKNALLSYSIVQSVKINIKCLLYSKPCSCVRNYMPKGAMGPLVMAMVTFCLFSLNYYNCVVAFKVYLTKVVLIPRFNLMVYSIPSYMSVRGTIHSFPRINVKPTRKVFILKIN